MQKGKYIKGSSEQKSHRIGFLVSLLVHILLVVIFFLVYAWKPPIPPPPEYGIELMYGLDEAGQGEQPSFLPTTQPQPIEQYTPTEPSSQPIEPLHHEADADVSLPQEAPPKPEPKPTPTPKPAPPEPQVPPQPNPKALFNPDADQGKGDDGRQGNKGRQEGTLDGRGLYGGGEGGYSVSGLDGWRLNCKLNVQDNSGEEGVIVFEIAVSAMGTLEYVRTRESNVSPRVVNIYRDAIHKQIEGCLEKSSARVPDRAQGTIIFYLRAK